MDYNQMCDLANRDAYMWLCVNESVLDHIWILSGYKRYNGLILVMPKTHL